MSALGPNDVHLWLAFYGQAGDALDAMLPLLSEAELAQGERYRAADDRLRYLVTRALARTVLSRYADVAPSAWRFAANAHGRPEIAAHAAAADGLRFNLSHTRGLIAMAVGRRRELGVDVECLNARQVSLRLAQRFFSPDEASALSQACQGGMVDSQLRLMEYWTFKEAYIKARGQGLNFPLDRFSVVFPDAASARLEIDPALEDDPARWYLAQYRPAPDYLLALCAERQGGIAPQVTLHQVVPTCAAAPCAAPLWRSSDLP